MDDRTINSLRSQIQSLMTTQPDFTQKLRQRLVIESVKVENPFQFIASLLNEGVLHDRSNSQEVGLKEMMVQLAMMIACSEGPDGIGGLMEALGASGNSQVISALQTWVSNDFPTEARASPADNNTKEGPKPAGPKLFKQASPVKELSKVATFNSQSQSSGSGTFSLEFGRTGMIAHLDDSTIKQWNWKDDDEDEENTMAVGVNVKVKTGEAITFFQYDGEILIAGTSAGTVSLCVPKTETFEEKWSIRLGEPIDSLKFVESSILIRTRGLHDEEHFWFVQICRREMQLLNQKLLPRQDPTTCYKFLIDPLHIFLYSSRNVKLYETKSGRCVAGGHRCDEVSFSAPAVINTLHVLDLISSKRVVIAGCKNGVIAMWNTSSLRSKQHPFKTFQGHSKAIVSLCAVNGHLISMDESGKLHMWSGYDLKNVHVKQPVPRLLAQNFDNVSCLVGCERWLASSSSKDGVINVWTFPDSWLRTG